MAIIGKNSQNQTTFLNINGDDWSKILGAFFMYYGFIAGFFAVLFVIMMDATFGVDTRIIDCPTGWPLDADGLCTRAPIAIPQ